MDLSRLKPLFAIFVIFCMVIIFGKAKENFDFKYKPFKVYKDGKTSKYDVCKIMNDTIMKDVNKKGCDDLKGYRCKDLSSNPVLDNTYNRCDSINHPRCTQLKRSIDKEWDKDVIDALCATGQDRRCQNVIDNPKCGGSSKRKRTNKGSSGVNIVIISVLFVITFAMFMFERNKKRFRYRPRQIPQQYY